MAQKIISPKAELAVLRGLCHKDRIVAGTLLAAVDESYFATDEGKEIFTALSSHFAVKGAQPKYKLVLEDTEITKEARSFFRDSEAVIDSVQEAQTAINTLNNYRRLRQLHGLAAHIDAAMQKSKVNVEELLDQTADRLTQARSTKASSTAFTHFGKDNNSRKLIEDLLYGEGDEDIIQTGIKPFDEAAYGLARGSLVTIGASSGGGKSLVASTEMAMNMALRGYKVVVVPLEMSRLEMTARFIAKVTGLDVTRILYRKLTATEKNFADAKFTKWLKKVKKAGGRLTVYKPPGDVSIEEIFAGVQTYVPDVLIVDYISLLKGVDGDDAWQKLGAVARAAKINAESTNRVNILLCQVSDDGKVRYARAISEHSTNSWVWVATKEERAKKIGRIRVEQPKGRNSGSFPFELGIEWACMRVTELDEQEGDGQVEEMKNLTADI